MSETIRTVFVMAIAFSLGTAKADEKGPKPQYVYKTIGDRDLTVDILYPDAWKPTDRRASVVFFSGGAWRSGGTSQFAKQADYFAKRGLVTVRAEYRDSTSPRASHRR